MSKYVSGKDFFFVVTFPMFCPLYIIKILNLPEIFIATFLLMMMLKRQSQTQ